jgi:succinyl-CoA synthetase beta subunit
MLVVVVVVEVTEMHLQAVLAEAGVADKAAVGAALSHLIREHRVIAILLEICGAANQAEQTPEGVAAELPTFLELSLAALAVLV